MGQPAPKSDRPAIADEVLANLAADKPVNVELSGGGLLHVERPMPLLCVYRRAAGDIGTEQLVAAEAAYMVVPTETRSARPALKLLRAVVEQLANRFGSFLVIEIWSTPSAELDTPPALQNGNGHDYSCADRKRRPGHGRPRAAPIIAANDRRNRRTRLASD